jgi:hypothetical protein
MGGPTRNLSSMDPFIDTAIEQFAHDHTKPRIRSRQCLIKLKRRSCSLMKSGAHLVSPVVFGALALLLGTAGLTEAGEDKPNPASPDKQWEYKCTDGLWSSIVNAATGKMELDLSNAVNAPYCNDATVIWSPDSKRFAFNYSPSHAPHTVFETVTFFELRDGKWVEMPDLLEDPHIAQLVQLGKNKLPKNLRARHQEADHDVLKMRNWIDATTAVLYASALWAETRSPEIKAAYLFTIQFDTKGQAKVIKAERAPDTGNN